MKKEYHLRLLYFEIVLDEKQKSGRFVILKFFLGNSGWKLPFLLLCLILSWIMATYSFSWYITEWKNNNLKSVSFSLKIKYYIIISSVSFILVAAIACTLVVYIRRTLFKLFIYMIKGIFGHGIEFFHKLSSAQVINSIITEFTTLDETMGNTFYSLFQQIIRLHVVFLISLYQTYLTGLLIIVVYLLIAFTLMNTGPSVKSLANVVQANQAVLSHTVLHSYRNLPFYRNNKKIKYHIDKFMFENQVYQNSKVHQNNLADRWIYTRIHGFVLFLPFLILLNGFLRGILTWRPDSSESIKLTISLDLVFNISGLVTASINRGMMLASLEKIRELMVIDEMTYKRMVKSADPERLKPYRNAPILEIERLSIANPVTTLHMLDSISLRVEKEERLALIGSRGSGKSTLLAAIQRLVNPSQILEGQIYLKGNDTKDFTDKQLNKDIMRLSGSYKLYNGSLKFNIDPSNEFTVDVVEKVLEYIGYWMFTKNENSSPFHPSKNYSRTQTHSEKIQNIKNEFSISNSLYASIPQYSFKHEELAEPGKDDLYRKITMRASKSVDLKRKQQLSRGETLLRYDDRLSEDLGKFIYLMPKSQNKMNEVMNKEMPQIYSDKIPALDTNREDEFASPVRRETIFSNNESNNSHLTHIVPDLMQDDDLRVEGSSVEDIAQDKLCGELMIEHLASLVEQEYVQEVSSPGRKRGVR